MKKYVKDYRDALAHRIPLYLPPSVFNEGEAERYNAIENDKLAALRGDNTAKIQELEQAQTQIGQPCFIVMHSLNPEEPSRPIRFHAQTVTDVQTLVEFGSLFLDHWSEQTA